MARKPTETVPLMLRLPEGLRRRIEQAARRSDRSMNAEVIDRLERSFGKGLFEDSVEAWAEAQVRPVGAAIERGVPVETLTTMFPKWMLFEWAEQHPEHPETDRVLEAIGLLAAVRSIASKRKSAKREG